MKRKGFTLIELMIVIAIIGILAAMAIPNFKKARESAREKACYSNIRVILGAVEMYNMDNSTMMTSLSVDDLVKGKYLKAAPSKPEVKCSYFANGDVTASGFIECGWHGDPEGRNAGGMPRN